MKKAFSTLVLACVALVAPPAKPAPSPGRALQWEFSRPGRTWVIGSNRACQGDFCAGFTYVVCADPAR